MSVRELVVLGTGADVPTKRRNLHSLLIRWDDEGLLIDPGEGTQRQMIYCDVTATSISRVFVSRFVPDHCLGLAGLVQRISLDRVPHAIDVAFPASGRVFYERLRKASVYHAAAHLTPVPLTEPGPFVEEKELRLLAAPVVGRPVGFGLRLEERDRQTMLPERLREYGVHGAEIKRLQQEGAVEVDGKTVRLEDVSVPRKGQAVAYLPPTRPCLAAHRLALGAAILVCRGVLPDHDAERAERRNAMTASEAGRLAKTAGVGRLVLTGFPPEHDDPSTLAQEVAETFGPVAVAEDEDRIPIPRPPKAGRE